MRVLVTGATGYLGAHVVRELLAGGHQVRAFVRSTSDRSRLQGLTVEYAEGDVTAPETLRAAMGDVDAVVHLAGVYGSSSLREEDFFAVNTAGTQNVRGAATAAGVKRMVFVSSGSTIGERPGEIGTETTRRRDYVLGHYEASKLAAEEALSWGEPPPEIVIVNPASVYGPGDTTANGNAIIGAMTGRLRVSIDVIASFVYVDDAVKGIVAALLRGRPGERYILAGQQVSRLEFLRRAVELADVPHEIRAGGRLTWHVLAVIYTAIGWLTRSEPPVSGHAVRVAFHGNRLDGGKAERELGVAYTSLDDGLNATLDWLHEEGYVDLPEEDDDEDSRAVAEPADEPDEPEPGGR